MIGLTGLPNRRWLGGFHYMRTSVSLDIGLLWLGQTKGRGKGQVKPTLGRTFLYMRCSRRGEEGGINFQDINITHSRYTCIIQRK